MLTVIASLKGGTGKSTLAFNLGLWLAHRGQSPQMLDLDPQQTLTDVIEVRQEEGYEPALVVKSPSLRALKNLNVDGGQWLADVSVGDTPCMNQALRMADRIVVPVPPSQADVWSLQRFLEQVAALDGEKSPAVHAFINRADTHISVRESDETADALSAIQNLHFLNPRLSQRTLFRRSFSEGLGVFEMEPRSKASQEFQRLAQTLFPQYKKRKGKTS